MSRDILAPPLQRMSNNRNYRVNIVHEDFGGNKFNNTGKAGKSYVEQDLYGDDDNEDDLEICNIEGLSDGSYKLIFNVPKSFYGGIIGFKGSTKRRIETETQTEILIPRQNDKSSDVTIKGKERTNVCTALRKLRLLIDSLRQRMRPTHFLAVRLDSGDIQQKFLTLKQCILDAQLPGIDECLFMRESCLHITIGLYILLDDAERQMAVEHLKNCREYLKDVTTPFEVKVKGLEIMNDDPSATRVVYACIESSHLQQYANNCLAHFQKTGLYANEKNHSESIKLHMTVLNNRYGKIRGNRTEDNFDAREILKRYGDYDFGTIMCDEVHLCIMDTSTDTSFYKTTGSFKFQVDH